MRGGLAGAPPRLCDSLVLPGTPRPAPMHLPELTVTSPASQASPLPSSTLHRCAILHTPHQPGAAGTPDSLPHWHPSPDSHARCFAPGLFLPSCLDSSSRLQACTPSSSCFQRPPNLAVLPGIAPTSGYRRAISSYGIAVVGSTP